MSKLRLGPVVEERPVKLTVELPGSLVRDLADYAAIHARLNGLATPLAPEKLIAPMVGRFIGSDREFSKQRRRKA
ncbi:DUF2274 domain-containing protein [Sphingopyxis sp. OPL5]|uniref:DUF2274 domain-containing protein n=1 Tax=Sphingopyxis sp. OPL5 TaxID=2486273 RepID=UPI0008ABF039|nr:DUF2274 domain-containing protein [Sphingopyxis sp. OPL5]OHD04125.1 MAG: hypothetical protein A2885_00425 [Sphingopyxis sp. RIFCSPHIGHO2_01_FULL_65_24]QNO27725.1 DUF2274 domain-containing protein [Sphingopyxis sp. OPL5]